MSSYFNSLLLLLTLGIGLFATEEPPGPAIQLGAPFRDHAVLQRGMDVPVWGWSGPGTKVTVEFAGQTKTAVAGKSGKWMLSLDPLKASAKPAELKVAESTGKRVTLRNILVGEVWLASGQSNMQWKVNKSSTIRLAQAFTDETQGKPAPIREFEVTSVMAMLHPIEKADGAWKDGNYADYSAIAFAFAHKLHKELGVPIGILNCSFSQTAIQAWVPREGFRDAKDAYTQAIYQKILETDPTTPEHKAAWTGFYEGIEATLRENAERVAEGKAPQPISTRTPGNLSGNRDASWLFNGRLNPVVPYAIRGGIWNQGYANMGEGLPYYHNLHNLVRGWRLVWDKPELPVYFHQFYCPGQKGEWNHSPRIGGVVDMRLGTWLARDIPHTGMASQIDVTGGIHYTSKTVPGQRLALHALKNQYGQKELAADGPSFKDYEVRGDRLIVKFDQAEGGLVAGSTAYNTDRRNKDATGFADPKVIPDGENQVKGFYLAGADRVWHRATVKLDGETVVLHALGVKQPRGVSYGTGGIGFQPNLYNRALLPMTPFIYYDQKRVTAESWPDEKLKVAGVVPAAGSEGLLYEWRKMPLLSTQFRENAVLQADQPITFWGSVLHDYGVAAEGEAVVEFSFADIKKRISVKAGSPHIYEIAPGDSRYPGAAKEWRVTVPAMKASAEPKTLTVRFLIDGELAHERICRNIVVGDVWFVASHPGNFEELPDVEVQAPVRMMTRKAKRFSHPTPSRYTVCVSRTPLNRFACVWTDATGLPAALGNFIAAKTGRPVGVIFMKSGMTSMGRGVPSKDLSTLKSWIPVNALKDAPSLFADYKDLAAVRPGNSHYAANVRQYLDAWRSYWNDYIPKMVTNRSVPDGLVWGNYPTLTAGVTSQASEVYNTMVHSFTPTQLKGILFLAGPATFAEDGGARYGEQMTTLANSWKKHFGGKDPHFLYTLPDKSLAPKITQPKGIRGRSTAIPTRDWTEVSNLLDALK